LTYQNCRYDAAICHRNHTGEPPTWHDTRIHRRYSGGGAMEFFPTENFFSDNTRIRIFFFFLSRREFFFLEFNIRLYDKNSEADLFLLPPESEYFFSNIGNQNIFFRKYTHPFKLNGRFLRRAWGYQGGNQNLYMKNRQHNGQRKKDKKTIYKTYT
jgi:hypothetical protein